ncbi:MAG: hypothetical protein ACYDDF_15170 [Thermoplasmatota archaeon]
MRSIIVLALLALLAIPPVHATPSTVTLVIQLGSTAAPADVSCAVSVDTPTTGAAVLDAAVASGCLRSWSNVTYPGLGREVTCIDEGHANICQESAVLEGTAWWFYINGQVANSGVDNTDGAATINAGDTVGFVYQDWYGCGDTTNLCGFGVALP